jgi:CDP-diglyceride synthetase
MACWGCLFRVLMLLVVANGAPVMADRLWGRRYAKPIDAGLELPDGKPLFGKAKTWRGMLASVAATSAASGLIGWEWATGAVFALYVMIGDLISSFIKRRLKLKESSRARGLDTLPESVLPSSLLKEALGLSWGDIALIGIGFLLIEEWISPILYKLHIKKRPY